MTMFTPNESLATKNFISKWPDAQPGLDAQRKHAKRLEECGGKKRFIVKKVEKAVY